MAYSRTRFFLQEDVLADKMKAEVSRREFLAAGLIALGGCVGLEKNVDFREIRPFNTFTKHGVHFYEEGKGDLDIVFVHGYGGRAEDWQEQVKELSKKYKTYAIDLPGAGYSAKPDEKITVERSAKDLEEFVGDAGIEKAFFVGLSRGSSVIPKFAAKNPEKVRGIVLCSAYIEGYTEIDKPIIDKIIRIPGVRGIALTVAKFVMGRWSVRANLEKLVVDKSRITEGMVESYYEVVRREDGFDAFVNMGENLDLRVTNEEISLIRTANIPFIYISGEKDKLVEVKDWESDEKILKMTNTGHLINFDKPQILNEIIVAFVELHK